MNEERQRRAFERLEQRRQQLNERLEKQQTRINARFDQEQAKIVNKLNLKQEQIIAAALELLTQDGLNNLSLREIAKRLHMQAPALYWYFKSKEDLVDYMAEAILQKEFTDLQPRRDDETWQDWLTQHMLQLRKAMLAYPDGARVVAGARLQPAITLAKSMEASLVSLQTAGVDPQTARRVIMTATTYTFGYVIEEQAAPTPEQLAKIDLSKLFADYPNVMKVATEAVHTRKSIDEDFLIGLQYIIRGSTRAIG